jgi:hypothetical protein
MKQQFFSLVLLCTAGMLVHASDKSAYEGTIALGKFPAKKYVLNNYAHKDASSKVCFALVDSSSTASSIKIVVYNRKASYNKCAEKTLPFSGHVGAITIINDTHIVTGQEYKNGLYVTPIFWEEAAKNIKLPAYTSPSGIDTNDIKGLHAIKNSDMHFLCQTSSAGVFVLDLSTEKVTHNFKQDYISSASPNASGDGVWYISDKHNLDDRSVQYKLGHYDLRSAKTTTNIDMPKNINSLSFSVNPSGTRCAFTSKNDRVHIFDITAQKTDQTLFMPDGDRVDQTMFISDTMLMYETKKLKDYGSSTEHQLHSFSVSSEDRERCNVPHYTKFHKNTGLAIGYDYLMSLTIYDFDFKQ